ncbi:MAG: chemotaxis protein CheW [Ilumatobacteraceae bacterium]
MTAIQGLLIPVGEDVYAIDAVGVREVVPEPVSTRIPTASAVMLGVFNLRGEVVPLFDTAALLGVGHTEVVRFVVVVATSAGLAGLAANGLPKVIVLEDRVGPSELRGTLGTYMFADGVAVLLDVETLLEPADSTGSAGVRGQAS